MKILNRNKKSLKCIYNSFARYKTTLTTPQPNPDVVHHKPVEIVTHTSEIIEKPKFYVIYYC